MLDICHVHSKQKEADMAMLISDKTHFKSGNISRNRETEIS